MKFFALIRENGTVIVSPIKDLDKLAYDLLVAPALNECLDAKTIEDKLDILCTEWRDVTYDRAAAYDELVAEFPQYREYIAALVSEHDRWSDVHTHDELIEQIKQCLHRRIIHTR